MGHVCPVRMPPMNVPSLQRPWITWERVLVIALASLLALLAQAQDPAQAHQDELEKITVGDNAATVASLELMPDGNTLLVSAAKDQPIRVVNVADWKVTRSIAVHDYPGGPDVKTSARGTYLLLRKRYVADWNVNRDQTVRYEVLEFASGRTLFAIANAHDVRFAPDEKSLYALEGENVTVRSLPDGNEVGRIVVPLTRSSLAISPDGKLIAVSHRPTQPQLETVPSMRNDKRAMKPALKFREMVSVYNTADGKLVGTIAEIYDVIYTMAFTPAGDRLLIYSIPDTRFNQGNVAVSAPTRQGIVNTVAMPAMEPLRTGFMSAMNEPQLELNAAADRLALASTEGFNKRKLYVYDTATGEFTLDLDMDQKWFRDIGQDEAHDGTLPYHFLPDGRTLIVGSGFFLRKVTTP